MALSYHMAPKTTDRNYWERARNLYSYLRVERYQDTMHYEYLEGKDKHHMRQGLRFLEHQKRLGHGTLGDVGYGSFKKNSDYESALTLLSIILDGDIRDSCVNLFHHSLNRKNPYCPDRYGPFFVVLKKGITVEGLQDKLESDGIEFTAIPREFHEMYFVPRPKERLIFYDRIWAARHAGIITLERAQEASLMLVTPKQIVN